VFNTIQCRPKISGDILPVKTHQKLIVKMLRCPVLDLTGINWWNLWNFSRTNQYANKARTAKVWIFRFRI